MHNSKVQVFVKSNMKVNFAESGLFDRHLSKNAVSFRQFFAPVLSQQNLTEITLTRGCSRAYCFIRNEIFRSLLADS